MFDSFTGYEKGVAARALLESLTKKSHLEVVPSEDKQGEIMMLPINQWQLEFLSCFSEQVRQEKKERQKLREILCQDD